MKRKKTLLMALIPLLAVVGVVTGVVVGGPSAAEHSACVTASATVAGTTVPDHVIGADGSPVYTFAGSTIPGASDTQTVCVTATDQTTTDFTTVTTTVPGTTTSPVTTTNPVTTTTTTTTPPGQTWQQAYDAASPGATIIIPDGTYPVQTLGTGQKSGAPVTFQAAHAGQAKVAGLEIDLDRIHVVGVVSSGTGEGRHGLGICDGGCPAVQYQDIVIDGFHGKDAFIAASGVTVIRSEFGGFDACLASNPEDAFRFWGRGPGVNATPTNDKLLHSRVHDVTSGSGFTCQGTVHAGYHSDCMQTTGGANILVQDSVFDHCPTNNIQASPFAGATIGNFTVDRTYLGQTACCNSIVLGADTGGSFCSTLKISNSFYFIQPNLIGCAGRGVQLSGNTLCSNTSQSGCAIPSDPILGTRATK